MKRFSTWALIIGIILLAVSLISLGTLVANPTDMADVNTAMALSQLAWVALGGFLIFCYFIWKPKEDELKAADESVKDSEEVLRRSRNWILGFIILLTAMGSIEMWLLNDYAAGATLVNITVIFDLVAILVLLYLAIELFRNKRDISKLLLVAILVYAIIEGTLFYLRGFWFGPVVHLLFAVYFAFALLAPLTRKNHRIANFVLLPIAIAALFAWGEFDNGNLQSLSEQYALREQQFVQDAAVLQGAYNIFLQKENPINADITSVRDAIDKREARIQELFASISELEKEYERHLPNVAQRKILEQYGYLKRLLTIHQEQAQVLDEFMVYASGVNFAMISDEQAMRIVDYKTQIDEIGMKLAEVEFELAHANLEIE
jgi:hypothetical protein